MKKILIYILLILLSACTTPEKKAKKLIESELYLTLNDFKSYEPVSYSSLDSLYSTYEMDSLYIKNEKLKIKLKEFSELSMKRYKENKQDEIYSSSSGKWRIDMSIFITNLIFEQDWYQITNISEDLNH